MFEDNFNNNIWNEHEWEAHLEDIERQHVRLGNQTDSDVIDQILHWLLILRDNSDTFDTIDEIIQYEILMDEPYFLGNDEEKLDDFQDDDLNDFFLDEDISFDEEDFDSGEEWKELSDDYTLSEYGSIENLDIYNESRELAALILGDAETIDPDLISEKYSEFVVKTLTICAKITAGYSFGFEPEFMGANIAYTKKALHLANSGLLLLYNHLKKSPAITKKRYYSYHEKLFELRNNIGIYIQHLRAKFHDSL